MRLIKQLFIGLSLLIATATTAQTNLKFGHVNTQAILQEMPELKSVEDQLQAEYDKLEKQLTDMQEALKTIQQQYIQKMQAKSFAVGEQQSLEQQLQDGNQKVQAFYMQSQQSLQAKEQELKLPIFEKLTDAIKAVGEEGGFLYIFEEVGGLTVYKSEKSIDIAPLVKAKLGIQ